MRTITQWVNKLNKMIMETPYENKGIGHFEVKYVPEFRYISFSGDSLLMFRGTISTKGDKILITSVNAPGGFDMSVKPGGMYLSPLRQLSLAEFEDAIKQKMWSYSPLRRTGNSYAA